MQTIELNGKWTLAQVGEELSLAANVPGDVMTELVRAKKLPDPYYRENETLVQWVCEADWDYTRTFKVSAKLLGEDQVLLQCEGLDTFADVEINGTAVASADNMHRTYEWDVKPLLKAGTNSIRVRFRSVNDYTRACFKKRALYSRVSESHPDAYPAFVRKEACNFGWDWGPILATCGIWRAIRIVGYSVARLEDMAIEQAHEKGKVTLGVACRVSRTQRQAVTLRVSVRDLDFVVAEQQVAVGAVKMVRVDLPIAKARL